jgi:tetratricopeptide (TPR) repeat protein
MINSDNFQKAFELHKDGRTSEAEEIYKAILKEKPNDFNCLHLLGLIANEKENYEAARELISKALLSNPNSAEAHYNLGNSLKKLNKLNEAIHSYDNAINIKKDYEFYFNRGYVLNEIGQIDSAIDSYNEAIKIKPDYAEAFYNIGIIFKDKNKDTDNLSKAILNFNKAIEIKPDYAEALLNKGMCLHFSNRIKPAIESYDAALKINPDYEDAKWNKSLSLLLIGNFDQGWILFESRWKRDSFTEPRRNFSKPLWLGEESLKNKTILLYSEQGLGDTIQFVRYAKIISQMECKVILEIPESLVELFKEIKDFGTLIKRGEVLPDFDYQCPLLSLPLAFKTNITNIPFPNSYLFSKTKSLNKWAKKLNTKLKPRVGLVWSGKTTHKNDHNRSFALSSILSYLPDNFEYFSIQNELQDKDKSALSNSKIKHFGAEIENFDDTAALCSLMDIIISVDTSIAHLSGALGKKTWVLLPFNPDWRWLMNSEDTPWYSSAKLYRQAQKNNWQSVFNKIKLDLLDTLEKK